MKVWVDWCGNESLGRTLCGDKKGLWGPLGWEGWRPLGLDGAACTAVSGKLAKVYHSLKITGPCLSSSLAASRPPPREMGPRLRSARRWPTAPPRSPRPCR